MAKKERSEEQRKVSEALLDELLDGRDAREVIESGDLFRDLKKSPVERILDTEMDVHLEGGRASGSGNHRNGHNRKRVVSESGAVDLEVPRDREGTFEPLFVERYRRRLPRFDERVVSLYARGMSTREIRSEIEEAYGVPVSAELVSRVTDAVHGEIKEWQSRPLEEVYAIMYMDAVRVKMRDEGVVSSDNQDERPCCLTRECSPEGVSLPHQDAPQRIVDQRVRFNCGLLEVARNLDHDFLRPTPARREPVAGSGASGDRLSTRAAVLLRGNAWALPMVAAKPGHALGRPRGPTPRPAARRTPFRSPSLAARLSRAVAACAGDCPGTHPGARPGAFRVAGGSCSRVRLRTSRATAR